MPPKKSNLNNARSREAQRKRVERAHQSAEQITARNAAQRIRTAEIRSQDSKISLRPTSPASSLEDTEQVCTKRKLRKKQMSPEQEPEPRPKKRKGSEDKCCCCLKEAGNGDLWTNRKNTDNEVVYGKLLQECFSITFDNTNLKQGYKICNACKDQLKQALKFKHQVLKCKEKLHKLKKKTLSSESEPLELDDSTDEDMVDRKKQKLMDSLSDDDQPLASLEKTEDKEDSGLRGEEREYENQEEGPGLSCMPKTNKRSKKTKNKKLQGKKQDQDPVIIDLLQESDQQDDDVFVNNDAPADVGTEQPDNICEIKPELDVAGIKTELEQDNNNEDNNVDETEPEPGVSGIKTEFVPDTSNREENVDEIKLEPEVDGATAESDHDNTDRGDNGGGLEPEPEVEIVKEELILIEENPIKINDDDVKMEADDGEASSSIKDEPKGDEDGVAENGVDENGVVENGVVENGVVENRIVENGVVENGVGVLAINGGEVAAEPLHDETPDRAGSVNGTQEPGDETECVSSTIDDSKINDVIDDPVPDFDDPDMNGPMCAVKRMDSIFNFTLREMLARPSNILARPSNISHDMTRKGHLLQGFNERWQTPPPRPGPRLRTMRPPNDPRAERNLSQREDTKYKHQKS